MTTIDRLVNTGCTFSVNAIVLDGIANVIVNVEIEENDAMYFLQRAVAGEEYETVGVRTSGDYAEGKEKSYFFTDRIRPCDVHYRIKKVSKTVIEYSGWITLPELTRLIMN